VKVEVVIVMRERHSAEAGGGTNGRIRSGYSGAAASSTVRTTRGGEPNCAHYYSVLRVGSCLYPVVVLFSRQRLTSNPARQHVGKAKPSCGGNVTPLTAGVLSRRRSGLRRSTCGRCLA